MVKQMKGSTPFCGILFMLSCLHIISLLKQPTCLGEERVYSKGKKRNLCDLGEEEAYACLKEEAYNVQLKRE